MVVPPVDAAVVVEEPAPGVSESVGTTTPIDEPAETTAAK